MNNEHEKDTMLLLEVVEDNMEKAEKEAHDPFLDPSALRRDTKCHHHHFQRKHNSSVKHQVGARHSPGQMHRGQFSERLGPLASPTRGPWGLCF